jgi:hypothetical protein
MAGAIGARGNRRLMTRCSSLPDKFAQKQQVLTVTQKRYRSVRQSWAIANQSFSDLQSQQRRERIAIRDDWKADSDPIEIEDMPASRRQRILELLSDGGTHRSTCIATHLGCSLNTVKRELETLHLAGKIKFIGRNKTGTYQLVNN